MCVPVHVCPVLCLSSLRQSVPAHIYVPETSGHWCVSWHWLLAWSSVPSVAAIAGLLHCKHYAHVPLQQWQSIAVSEIRTQDFSQPSAAKESTSNVTVFRKLEEAKTWLNSWSSTFCLIYSDAVKHSCSVFSSYAQNSSVTCVSVCWFLLHSRRFCSQMLILWSRVLLESPLLPQSTNSLHFIEPEVSLPHSQHPATCNYPEPVRSSPHTSIPFLKYPF